MLSSLFNLPTTSIPILCLVFYISALSTNIIGGLIFWRFSIFLGIISLLILLIYCLGSLPWVEMSTYTATYDVTGYDDASVPNQWFIGGIDKFMAILPLAPWFYVGVEAINLYASIAIKVDFFQIFNLSLFSLIYILIYVLYEFYCMNDIYF